MVVKIYGIYGSPVVRAVLLTAKAIGLDIEFVEVNILEGANYKPEYLKINPLHTIPAMEDGDFTTWDSHVINGYLVDKYGKDDSLYPKDLQKRAVIDQRLFFHCGITFPRFGKLIVNVIRNIAKTLEQKNIDLVSEAYGQLELLLEKGPYVTGETLTIADFSLVATVTSADVLVPISSNKFPKVTAWISKMQALPYYAEANQKGLDKFTELIKSKLA